MVTASTILFFKGYISSWVLPYGSQLLSGMFVLEMECTGIVLLSTGFICLSSRAYLFQGGPVIPFQIQAFRFSDLPPPWRASVLRRLTESVTCASTRLLCVPLGLDPLVFCM